MDMDLRFPRWGWALLVIAFVALVALAVWLVRADDDTVRKAAGVGDAAAAIATLFTAGALVATVWQAHLQRRSVEHQVAEMVGTRTVLEAQAAEAKALVEHQKELLDHQRELLDHQRADMRARHIAELRRAYAEWFAATDTWLSAVFKHGQWLQGKGSAVDRVARRNAEDPLFVERDKMFSARWLVKLAETDEVRLLEVDVFCDNIKTDIELPKPDAKDAVMALGSEIQSVVRERYKALNGFQERLRVELLEETRGTSAPAARASPGP